MSRDGIPVERVDSDRGEENTLADARAGFFLYCHGPVPSRLRIVAAQDLVQQLNFFLKIVNDSN